jgi:multidrug efflux pump subunit AcrA (membrane-fusion protein)
VTRTYSARITVRNADSALRLGMTAAVVAPDVDGRTATRLPLTAIYDRNGTPQVWVVDGATSRVAARPVRLGAVHQDSVLVADGLAGGETVVTAGAHLLHEGQRVKAVNARP